MTEMAPEQPVTEPAEQPAPQSVPSDPAWTEPSEQPQTTEPSTEPDESKDASSDEPEKVEVPSADIAGQNADEAEVPEPLDVTPDDEGFVRVKCTDDGEGQAVILGNYHVGLSPVRIPADMLPMFQQAAASQGRKLEVAS